MLLIRKNINNYKKMLLTRKCTLVKKIVIFFILQILNKANISLIEQYKKIVNKF